MKFNVWKCFNIIKMTNFTSTLKSNQAVVVVDQFTPGYQFTPTPKFIQNNHS